MPQLPSFGLQDKIVIVTGAGRGIGRTIALDAVKSGAKVAVGSRTTTELETLREEIEASGGECLVKRLDVVDVDSIQAFIDAGKLDAKAAIDEAALVACGLIRRKLDGVRVLKPATVAEMRELSIWQALSEANARAAEAEARAIETEMEPLKEQLARTLGRESVTETLIAAAERAALTDLERRREDAPMKSVRLGAGS